MRRMQLLILLLLATAPLHAGRASANIECVKTQCEAKGRSCVEALYVTYNACTKAARAACDKVPPAEKFNCLRAGLSPCAQTRNKEQAACFADVRSCANTCGPMQSKLIYYWCVADIRNGATAAFCPVDQGISSPFERCAKAFARASELEGGMTCEPLN